MSATAAEIIEKLRALGVSLTPIPPDFLRLEPASRVPPELIPRIVESKPAILAALARPTVEPADCQHCGGKGECDCPACNLRRTDKAVPCCMCRWADRQVWLVATRPEGCWHCAGSGKCGCVGCGRSGVCAVCGGKVQ
jgi:hypothetical protein